MRKSGKGKTVYPRNTTRGMLVAWVLLLGVAPPLLHTSVAQNLPPISSEAEFSLITMHPGTAIYSIYGHSALRVTDPAYDTDLLFNYGTFDFDWTFVFRFTYGLLDYKLSVSSFPQELYRYSTFLNRTVIEQKLLLSEHQKRELYGLLEENWKPENRTYRYDFLFDNCSTRLRDLLQQTLQDSLSFASYAGNDASFRQLIDTYQDQSPVLDLGIDIALGQRMDRQATPHEEMFLPMPLLDALDAATVQWQGDQVPLVKEKQVLFEASASGAPTKTVRSFPLLLWFIAAAGIAYSFVAYKRGWDSFWLDKSLFILSGIAGLVILFLWFVSLHTVTNLNWNLLWAWPTHLFVLFMLKKRPAWLRGYVILMGLGLLIALLSWLIPMIPQDLNPHLIPLLLLMGTRALSLEHRMRKGVTDRPE